MEFYKEKFKTIRKELRWTIVSLAKRCGVTRQTLFLWEIGKVVPAEEKIRVLASVLGIKVSTISTLKEDMTPSEKDIAPMLNLWQTMLNATSSVEFYSKKEKIVKQIVAQFDEHEQTAVIIRALLNAMPSIFYVKDKNMNYLIANNAFKEHLSIHPDSDVSGKNDSDFFQKRDADNNNEEDLSVFKTGVPIINREGFIFNSSKRKWGLISKYPVLDEHGLIIGVMGNIVDISKIKELEEIQQIMIDSISKMDATLGIYDLTEKKLVNYLSVNKVFGIEFPPNLNENEQLYYWLENMVHPDDREEQEKYLGDTENLPPVRKYRIIHPKKGIRTIEVDTARITTELKKTYLVSISRDITKNKK